MSIFKFKQFAVDQTGCAMKVNTDGVLLGALAAADEPRHILDIGTGTGVIALMLAQRYADAGIDAIEIDDAAAETAEKNFTRSPFAERLTLTHSDFAEFQPTVKYDLIVSNPPFFIDSLTSATANKATARHTDASFFERMVKFSANNLTDQGACQLILPVLTAALVRQMLKEHDLNVKSAIGIKSFATDLPHRQVIAFGKMDSCLQQSELEIYESQKVYSKHYANLLKDFLTIF